MIENVNLKENTMKKTEIIHHFINESAKGGIAILAHHNEGDSFFTMTTSICSLQDSYRKKTAVALLRENFQNDRVVRFPIDPSVRNKMTHRVLRDIIIFMFAAYQ